MKWDPTDHPALIANDPLAIDRPVRIASRRNLRVGVYAGLFAIDCLAVVVAILIANRLRSGAMFEPGGINALVVLLPAYLFIAADRRLYSARFFADHRRSGYDAARSMGAAMLAILFAAVYLRAGAQMSRIVVLGGGLLAMVLMPAARILLHRFALRITGGDPVATLMLVDGVEVAAAPGAILVDAQAMGIDADISRPDSLDRFGSLIKDAERVVIACPPDRRPAWVAMLKGANVQGEILVPELAALGAIDARRFVDQPTLVVSLAPLDTVNRIVKRGFDLVLASALLAIIWPLLLVIAIAIRLDSKGPIFFRQSRMGRGNRLFHVLKFRSMYADLGDAAGHRSTTRGDPRVTRVGRLIRATSIDELPQLFNVLRDDMSIVGPRPHALGSLAGDRLFWEVDPQYWGRHAIKPGITGLAQVNGHRGATAQASDLEARLRADLAYMSGWTIWRDIRILLATTRVVLHRNAF